MPTAPSTATRQVACDLGFEVGEGGVTMLLQVAPAESAGTVRDEHLTFVLDGEPIQPAVTELVGAHGTRIHSVRLAKGPVSIAYSASVDPHVSAGPLHVDPNDDVVDLDALVYLRQSRYCPSDEIAGFAWSELGHLAVDLDRPRAVADWVHRRLLYEGGASGPTDTAVDTLLAGRGVCRDFTHLTVMLCRALEIPARLVSVYAPGLSPMDFHAVVEARVGRRWEVIDATHLAPRQSLVRIATGRDAADTAFAATHDGQAELLYTSVTAVIDGELPVDDQAGPTLLA
jgi:transglutaminase-like putative cysteine protease